MGENKQDNMLNSSSASNRFFIPSANSTKSIEINEIKILTTHYVKEIVRFIIKDEFIEGEISKTQLYLENLYAEKKEIIFKNSFQKAWIQLYAMNNPVHLYTFACIASCLSFSWLEENGVTLLLGCSSHQDQLVNEACIRMAEAWEQPNHAEYLKKMRAFDSKCLEEYKEITISFLKGLM